MDRHIGCWWYDTDRGSVEGPFQAGLVCLSGRTSLHLGNLNTTYTTWEISIDAKCIFILCAYILAFLIGFSYLNMIFLWCCYLFLFEFDCSLILLPFLISTLYFYDFVTFSGLNLVYLHIIFDFDMIFIRYRSSNLPVGCGFWVPCNRDFIDVPSSPGLSAVGLLDGGPQKVWC